MFKHTIFTKAIFEALHNPMRPNIMVNAVAGSGKTTTIIEALKEILQLNQYCFWHLIVQSPMKLNHVLLI